MNKNTKRIIYALPFGVGIGFMFKYCGFQITLTTILGMILVEMFIGSDKE